MTGWGDGINGWVMRAFGTGDAWMGLAVGVGRLDRFFRRYPESLDMDLDYHYSSLRMDEV